MIEIRLAAAADAAGIRDIYAPYVHDTAITFDYEVPSVSDFEAKITETLKRYPYLVAVEDDVIVGYACASCFKSKAAYDWAVEMTVYVRSDMKRRGIGRALYSRLEEILASQGVTNVNACITHPNPGSVAFHESMGYRTAAHFTSCGYKLGRWWDMIWMEKFIGEHKNPPEPFVPLGEVNSIE